MPLLAVGTSHHVAPLEIRERLAFHRDDYPSKVRELRALAGVAEALLLSTCNRTEIYGIVEPDQQEVFLQWMRTTAGLDERQAGEHLYLLRDTEAVAHLFRVAGGLDSLVLGEPQIVGQLKEAWQQARAAGGLGKVTDRLFQHAFATGKTVRHQTGINEHPVSVAYITLVLARQIFGDLARKHVLLLGAGEMIELCGRHLHEQGVASLMIANRSRQKAEQLALQFAATPYALEELDQVLPAADIVVTSTASREPLIGAELIRRALRARRRRPIFLVDIAVPRDVDPRVAELDDVYLYTIDDLQQVAMANMQHRDAAAVAAQDMVHEAVEEFMRWWHGARAAASLQRLRRHAERSGEELAQRALRQIAAGRPAEEAIEQLANTLTHRILHLPSTRLRQAAEQQDYDTLKAADWLFEGEPEPDPDREPEP
ncbi:MAG: glutamyl-tRNA reductase [Xanthomonadales bacterium]|nr:glutamyl-tRNA reductase [Xanthomonadales bacterium]NIN59148.1 glutamyl-tRNA reductase [Xanthomonadales bacterium]NIN74459.1 glutamyl-tRNA reductase [Xanthomonadales bacterium]NIO13262.1 glutamyl-tRNA reductase [Xanthomonadales bacterium]NIP11541.1 glutamyl-tRNA reductase [Xanthomonadales bacterium]